MYYHQNDLDELFKEYDPIPVDVVSREKSLALRAWWRSNARKVKVAQRRAKILEELVRFLCRN